MGGKGQRRREKNYQAAHGGYSRLPPPPNPNEPDALPSKLRKIMELTNPSSTKTGLKSRLKDAMPEKGTKGGAAAAAAAAEKKGNQKDLHSSAESNLKAGEGTKKKTLDKRAEDTPPAEKGKRKRKRKEVKDLRFQELDEEAARQSRKARKKEYLEARKKKHKKAKKDDIPNFPGREQIKFGEVVSAPPKLTFPKALKGSLDASHERVRLQAIEAYRDRRGWVSRLGAQLPTQSEIPRS